MTTRILTLALFVAAATLPAAARADEPAASTNTTIHLDPGTLVAELRAFPGSKIYPAQSTTCARPCTLSIPARGVVEISGDGIQRTTLELDPGVAQVNLKLQAAPKWQRSTAVGLTLTSGMLLAFDAFFLPMMVNDHVIAGPTEKPGQFTAIAAGTLVASAVAFVAGEILFKRSHEAEVVH